MLSITKSRLLQCTLLPLVTIRPAVLHAQLPHGLRLALLKAQALGLDFEKRQNQFRLWKLQERRRVPDYDVHLMAR